MVRRVITDPIWNQLEQTLSLKGCHRWKNDRDIMEAILWKLRTGAPWRDIPIEFCPWKTAYNRFNRWAIKGLWQDFFLNYEAKLIRNGYSPTEVMLGLINMREELGVAKKEQLAVLAEALPQKFNMCADAHGNPVDFEITGGQVHDSKVAQQLIELLNDAEHFIADKGYDSDEIRDKAVASGMNVIIPRRANSKKTNLSFDSYLYKLRHLVENLFARLKHFRSIATRFEKLARNFKSMVYIACSFIWLKLKWGHALITSLI